MEIVIPRELVSTFVISGNQMNVLSLANLKTRNSMLAIRLPSRSPRRIQKRDQWKTNFSFAAATWVGHGSAGSVFGIDNNQVIKSSPETKKDKWTWRESG